MATKNNKVKDRQIGKKSNTVEKKHLIDPRYKNPVYTAIMLIVLLIFFIVNNTRKTPEHGPYPYGYSADSAKKVLNQNK